MFDEEKLILEVQEHKVLYDPNHRFYKDMGKKEYTWTKVAQAMGVSVEHCKNKWRGLRDSFVKSRKKLGQQGGSEDGAVKEWKYEKNMSFLIPHIVPRSSKAKLALAVRTLIEAEEQSSPRSLHGQDEAAEAAAMIAPISSPASSATSPERGRRARSRSPRERKTTSSAPRKNARGRRRAQPEVEVADRTVSIPENSTPRPDLPLNKADLVHHFVLSLVSALYELDSDLLRRAKGDILNTVHNYQAQQEQRQARQNQPQIHPRAHSRSASSRTATFTPASAANGNIAALMQVSTIDSDTQWEAMTEEGHSSQFS